MKKVAFIMAFLISTICFAQENIVEEEQEVQTEEEEVQIVEQEVPMGEEDVQMVEQEVPTEEEDVQMVEQEVPMGEEDVRDDEIKTLFKNNVHGGFGGVNVMYSEINSQDAVFLGGRGGWIIGHALSIGFGGCGYFNSSEIDDTIGIRNSLAGGHGGLYLEPILFPKFPVHLALPIFIGAGGISYIEYDNNKDYWEDEGNVTESDGYFIAEPGIELEFNLLKHFRMSLGVYYTYTSKIELAKVDGQPFGNSFDLNNLKYGVTFKFGKF